MGYSLREEANASGLGFSRTLVGPYYRVKVMMKSLKGQGGLTTGRSMTESLRQQWVHTMHRCSAVHNAVTMLTGSKTKTSEQYQEMGTRRRKRNHVDF